MTKRKKGFTLVELLVVVAIIALLVSILLPSLGKAKEQAKMVVCMTNLKALGMGFTFYTNQNNDWYPGAAGWGGDPPHWDHRLQPYYENYDLLHCPSDNLARAEWYVARGIPEEDRHPRSYGMNLGVSYRGPSEFGDNYTPSYGGETPYTSTGSVYRTTSVEIPSDTILLGDLWEALHQPTWAPRPGMFNQYWGHGIWDGMWTSRVPVEAPSRSPTFWHRDNNTANFLFCDSHVTPLPKDHPNLIDTNGNGVNDPGELYYYKREK